MQWVLLGMAVDRVARAFWRIYRVVSGTKKHSNADNSVSMYAGAVLKDATGR